MRSTTEHFRLNLAIGIGLMTAAGGLWVARRRHAMRTGRTSAMDERMRRGTGGASPEPLRGASVDGGKSTDSVHPGEDGATSTPGVDGKDAQRPPEGTMEPTGQQNGEPEAALADVDGGKGGRDPNGDGRHGGKHTGKAPRRASDGNQSPRPKVPDLRSPGLYVNRELGMLAFQRRVLHEAQDPDNPLLERIKFLAIVSSNLDEFFMVRVAGLRQQVNAGVVEVPPDGMTPAEQLAAIRQEALQLMQRARTTLAELVPRLADEGIHILEYSELTDRQRRHAQRYFDAMIFPVLTPLAHDPGRPFPFISNLSLNLSCYVRDERGDAHFARVKVPGTLPLLVPLKRSSGGVRKDGTPPRNHYLVWIEQVIAAHLDRLFPGMDVVEAHPFRVTRDADTAIQELEASDLLETIEDTVRQRRFGNVVRLTIASDMPERIRNLLADEMAVDPNDIYVVDGPLTLGGLWGTYGIDRHDLKYPHYVPSIPPPLQVKDHPSRIFDAIRREDIFLHHPYDSFVPVVQFLEAAAADPDVLAIKQTLYRVGRDSPIVDALLTARENGKQVAVLVELKARFDEESNIAWARSLEKEGVHVVYGLLGLKTHSKLALVVRKEGDRIRRYVHMATGNYNHITAHLYTDMGMFTCDEDIGADVSDVFNYLTGYSAKRSYRKLLVAPINFRERMDALIRREIEHANAGRPARLIFKMNALVDAGMIRSLYRASRAGVEIDLIVRGICCLRPGLPGVSETIQVTSIVGRFLEHSRVYYFHNGGEEEVYLGSADLMPRNIDRRVEVVFPVQSPSLVRRLRDEVLAVTLKDTDQAWRMQSDGSYEQVVPEPGEEPLDSQEWFMAHRESRQGDGSAPSVELDTEQMQDQVTPAP